MSVILTQVRLPERRKDLLRRARLIDLVHRNLHHKLTFITAPAGYGKTALLLDFASDLDAEVCWYSVGRDDADPSVFAHHLVRAFQQRFPDFGRRLAQALETSGDVAGPRGLATELVNEMVQHVDDFCVLMIDDYHRTGEIPAIVELMETLLEHLPDQVRAVVASRSLYGIPSARLYVRGQLAAVGTPDLRFRADELQDLCRQGYHVILSDEQAADLAARSDGWIVAILLAARAMQRGGLPRLEGSTDQIYGFLAEEVFAQQPLALRDFLLSTAIVDEFDRPLCAHLLESDAVGELLDELESRNLFVTRIESGAGAAYRYHQLFADFLRQRLDAADPERARRLHRRAAEWFAARQAWPAAVHHRLAAGDRLEAAAWMDRVAPALFVAGQTYTLSQWTEALAGPPDLQAHAPRLAVNQAKALIDRGIHEPAERLLDIAEPPLRRQADVDQIANLLITRGMIHLHRGEYARALESARAAQSMLAQPDGYRAYQALRLEGSALRSLGQLDEAIPRSAGAAAGFRRLGFRHDLAETLNDLGVFRLEAGDLLEAQRCFREVLDIRRGLGNPGALALALNNVAYLCHQVGQCAEAWRAYAEALLAAESVRSSRILPMIHNGRGDLLCDLDEWDAAAAAYAEARRIGERSGERERLAAAVAGQSELERLRGHFAEALHWLREAARHRGQSEASPDYQLGLGGIYLDMGQPGLADESLRRALEAWQANARPRPGQALAAFLLACAAFEQDRRAEADRWLGQALEWSARLGYDQFLVVAGRRRGALLAHAAQARPDWPLLRSLRLRVKQFRPGLSALRDEGEAAVVPAPLHLELLAFGPGRVRRNGELIPASAWASSRTRALFFYLADRGGARKQDIALEFWPDFSPAKVNSNFHMTMWRMRRAIGREAVVFEGDDYRLTPSASVWYDVAEFEAHLKRAASPEAPPEARAEAWRQAIALYSGDFLEDVSMAWADRRRAELQRGFIRAVAGLAEWEVGRRRFAEARALYEKWVALDPYLDEPRLGLMTCLAAIGARDEARAQYRTYETLLRDELGAAPGPALRALYDRLCRQG